MGGGKKREEGRERGKRGRRKRGKRKEEESEEEEREEEETSRSNANVILSSNTPDLVHQQVSE